MSIWLITGCSSGLGKGIAQAVLKRGEKAAETQTENRLKEIREWMEVSSQSDYR